MYNPFIFRSHDQSAAMKIIDQFPFATVISGGSNDLAISHLPLVLQSRGASHELVGHCARANPHWRSFEDSKTTAIFHGSHTYITPVWYKKNDVPTWNYSAVHVTGNVNVIEDHDEILECLKMLVEHAEKKWFSGWQFFQPDDLQGKALAHSIVGFKIKVEKIEFKAKLSQNRSALDRAGVMRGLSTRNDENSQQVLKNMQQIFSDDGEMKSDI